MNKKKLLATIVAGTMVMGSLAALVGCGQKGEAVTVWVSETEGVKTLTEQQITTFFTDNKEFKGKYKVTVEGISEGEAATQMVTDVATGADIFCYAQDQMGRLIEAKALSALGSTSAKFVQDNNDAGSVRAATVGTTVYSYPLTSDNGYFMYYDKSVVKESSLDDLALIVKDCEDASKNFSFAIEDSAWYTASFFFGVGCTSSWTYDNKTNKWKAADNFSDETKGLIALKGTQILTNSSAYVDSSKASDFGAATPSAVVVSGTWDAEEAAKQLGTNLGVAKLPKFTVDGKSYQLGSYSGYKLMGVKPQTDAGKAEFCHKLAQYLTGKDCQQARLEKLSWGPSNKEAAASNAAQENAALKGLAAQSPYATPQGQIHGGWWDFAKLLGKTKGKTEDELKDMLTQYKADLEKYEQMSEEEMVAFTIIGKIASLAGVSENMAGDKTWGGTSAEWHWDADLKMTKSTVDGKEVWKSAVKVTLAEGDEFKVRQGQSWTTAFGAVGDDGYSTGDNFTITAENAGTKYIVLTLTLDKDGKIEHGKVTLED